MSLFQLLAKEVRFGRLWEGVTETGCHLGCSAVAKLGLSFLGRSQDTWTWTQIAKAQGRLLPSVRGVTSNE